MAWTTQQRGRTKDKSVGLRHGYGRRDSYGYISGVFLSHPISSRKKHCPCHVMSLHCPGPNRGQRGGRQPRTRDLSIVNSGFVCAVWETCTEYHCTPTKVFFKVFTVVETTSSDCCNMAQAWLKGQSTDWLNLPSPTWSEKVRQHLPLGGVLREGSRS